MSVVCTAHDPRLDRTVAIKVLPEHVASDPDLKQRFEREAKTISSLNHPHIALGPTPSTTSIPRVACAKSSRIQTAADIGFDAGRSRVLIPQIDNNRLLIHPVDLN